MTNDNVCIHGTLLNEQCLRLCEHDKQCGAGCKECETEYRRDIDNFAALVGRGDRKKGAAEIVRMIKKIDAKEASDGN